MERILEKNKAVRKHQSFKLTRRRLTFLWLAQRPMLKQNYPVVFFFTVTENPHFMIIVGDTVLVGQTGENCILAGRAKSAPNN